LTVIIVLFCTSIAVVLIQSISHVLYIYFKQSDLIQELRKSRHNIIADEYEKHINNNGKYGYKSINEFFCEKKCLWKIIQIKKKSKTLNIFSCFLIANFLLFGIYILLMIFIISYYYIVVI